MKHSVACTEASKAAIEQATSEAYALRYEYILPIHLLLGLLRNPLSRGELDRQIGTLVDLQRLTSTVARHCPPNPRAPRAMPDPPFPWTSVGKQALARADLERVRRHYPAIDPLCLLVGLIPPLTRDRFWKWLSPEHDSASAALLEEGITSELLASSV